MRPEPTGGRPHRVETQLRTQQFLELVSSGLSFSAAAAGARVKPSRVLRLLDQPEFWGACVALRDQRLAA